MIEPAIVWMAAINFTLTVSFYLRGLLPNVLI